MTYQFDAVVDRSGNHSAKYDERKKKFGTEDVIPLWIAVILTIISLIDYIIKNKNVMNGDM